MTYLRAIINGEEIADKILVADGFFGRLKGLLKKEGLDYGEGLLLSPCNQIHTIGMKFDIDVVFLSKSGEIIHLQEKMEPGNVSKRISGSYQVLELKSGTINDYDIVLGHRIAFDSVI